MNQAPGPNRRTFLAQSLAAAGLLQLAPARAIAAPALVVANVTALYPVEVARIEAPRSANEIAALDYLPYQLHATREQFEQAYPEAKDLRRVKQGTDPAGKFSNELWHKYL